MSKQLTLSATIAIFATASLTLLAAMGTWDGGAAAHTGAPLFELTIAR